MKWPWVSRKKYDVAVEKHWAEVQIRVNEGITHQEDLRVLQLNHAFVIEKLQNRINQMKMGPLLRDRVDLVLVPEENHTHRIFPGKLPPRKDEGDGVPVSDLIETVSAQLDNFGLYVTWECSEIVGEDILRLILHITHRLEQDLPELMEKHFGRKTQDPHK